MRMPNAEIVEDSPTRMVYRDVGPWDQFPTITNQAEEFVQSIVGYGHLGSRRLFYIDSEDEWAELLIEDRKFAGFRPCERSVLPGQSITGAQAPLAFATADQEFPDASSGSDQDLGAFEDRENASLHSKAAGMSSRSPMER